MLSVVDDAIDAPAHPDSAAGGGAGRHGPPVLGYDRGGYERGRDERGRDEPAPPDRLPWLGRLGALAIGLGCLSLLVIASQTRPSPEGYGSHTGYPLRLQPCAFMEHTGLPCPSCGMTTSFCWFVRGNVVASAYVQPMGMLLAALAGCCVWGGLYVALTGRPAHRLLALLPGRYYSVPLLALALAAWAWKIFIHLKGIDGWR